MDRSYPEMSYPEKDYRLLALFRFWNVIDRFFPYKDLMDQPWDATLLEFIPKMEAAADALEYTLAVAELTARIQDSHGMIINPIYTRYTGRLNPSVQVSFVEGLSIISLIKDPALEKKGIGLGDVVLSVDGEKTEARRARLKRILPASTPGRLEAKVDMTLLAGDPEKPAAISLRKASGKIVNVTLPRTLDVPLRPEPSSLPNVTVLPDGFGYIDLGRLLDAEVGPALEKIKDTPGLVLDMRGYPIGGTFRLISRLARKKTPFTLFEFPEFSGAAGGFSTREETGYVYPDPDPFDYPGEDRGPHPRIDPKRRRTYLPRPRGGRRCHLHRQSDERGQREHHLCGRAGEHRHPVHGDERPPRRRTPAPANGDPAPHPRRADDPGRPRRPRRASGASRRFSEARPGLRRIIGELSRAGNGDDRRSQERAGLTGVAGASL